MTDVETKRDRVRRLVLHPLAERGMRFARGVSAEDAERRLNEIADALAYMADDRLRLLEECLRSKGEGSAKRFWPERVTIFNLAEACQPRPIEELPAMASWFGSVEGPRAREEGTLVATFLFIEKVKRPPYADKHRARVLERSRELEADMARVRDRIDRGYGSDEDRAKLRWYEGLTARAEALVDAGDAKRGSAS